MAESQRVGQGLPSMTFGALGSYEDLAPALGGIHRACGGFDARGGKPATRPSATVPGAAGCTAHGRLHPRLHPASGTHHGFHDPQVRHGRDPQ